jgi:hypothetical protein
MASRGGHGRSDECTQGHGSPGRTGYSMHSILGCEREKLRLARLRRRTEISFRMNQPR